MLTDDSKMPFGKFSGCRMDKVPAKYLLWLGSQIAPKLKTSLQEKDLLEYIKDNMQVLLKQSKEEPNEQTF